MELLPRGRKKLGSSFVDICAKEKIDLKKKKKQRRNTVKVLPTAEWFWKERIR